jgi:hypothetical protein
VTLNKIKMLMLNENSANLLLQNFTLSSIPGSKINAQDCDHVFLTPFNL